MSKKKASFLVLALSVLLIFSSGATLAQQSSLDIDYPDCPTFFNPPDCNYRADWTLDKWTDETILIHPNQKSFSFEVKVTENEPRRILTVDGTLIIVNTGEELSAGLTSVVLNLQLEGVGILPGLGEISWTTVQSAIANASELCTQSNIAKTCFGDFTGSSGSKLTLYDYLTNDQINLADLSLVPPTDDPECDNAIKFNFEGEFDITDTTFDEVRFEILVTFNGAGGRSCTTDVNCNGTIDPDDPATEMVNESEEDIRTVPQRGTFSFPLCADTLCTTAILSDLGAFSSSEDCIELSSGSLLDTLFFTGTPGTEYNYELAGTVSCHQRSCTTMIKNAATLELLDCDLILTSSDSFAVRCTTLGSWVNEEELEKTAKNFILLGNYPNPFNPNTEISYYLAEDAFVKVEIYNLLGQKVITLLDQKQTKGLKTIHWNGKDFSGKRVSSGIYFCRVQANNKSEIKKMALIK